MQCVENCDGDDPTRRVLYEQPVWQTLQMFRACPSPMRMTAVLIRCHRPRQSERCSVRLSASSRVSTRANDPRFSPGHLLLATR